MEKEDDEILRASARKRFIGKMMATWASFIGYFCSNGGETELGPPGTNLQ